MTEIGQKFDEIFGEKGFLYRISFFFFQRAGRIASPSSLLYAHLAECHHATMQLNYQKSQVEFNFFSFSFFWYGLIFENRHFGKFSGGLFNEKS